MKISIKTVPFALFTVCIFAFGLLIPFLGFYQDDWHPVFYGFARGVRSLWELFLFDNRPFATFIYLIGFNIIGYKPLHWHILALLLRGITVIFIWLSFCEIWPTNKREATWAAFLFAVYPFFKLQPLALIYTIHWTGFLLYSVSIWSMIRSMRKPTNYWTFTLLSLGTSILHMFVIEYFVGIELIRPVILWVLINEKEFSRRRTFIRIAKFWSPYLVVYMFYVIFRLFLMPKPDSGYDRNALWLVYDLIREPTATLVNLFESVTRDNIIILGAAWRNLINPDLYQFSSPVNLIAIFIALFIGIGIYFYLNNLNLECPDSSKNSHTWVKIALPLGLLLTFLGPIPGWLTTQFISSKNPLWSDRFGMASMVGASLVIVALLEALISKRKHRLIILSSLISLSVSWHIVNTDEYRLSWIKQSDFYQQLYWRAPFIESNTAIFSDSELFPRMGEYPTSFAINTMYPRFEDDRNLNYWFFSLYRHFGDKRKALLSGVQLEQSQYSSRFSADSRDSLVIMYEPDNNQCLWILRPQDQALPLIPEITKDLVAISSLDRIRADPQIVRPLPPTIYGNDLRKTWCYYFQKGDLARQFNDWDQTAQLWVEASENGLSPGNGVEYLPFIEGFIKTSEWELAEELTYQANHMTRKMNPILCMTWSQNQSHVEKFDQGGEIYQRIMGNLKCEEITQ